MNNITDFVYSDWGMVLIAVLAFLAAIVSITAMLRGLSSPIKQTSTVRRRHLALSILDQLSDDLDLGGEWVLAPETSLNYVLFRWLAGEPVESEVTKPGS